MSNTDFPSSRLTPCNPPDFHEPQLESCLRITARVLHDNGELKMHQNSVLVGTNDSITFSDAVGLKATDDRSVSDSSCSSSSSPSSSCSSTDYESTEESHEPQRGYLILDELADAIFGHVYYGKVVCRNGPRENWQMTSEECAIKEMSCEKVRKGQEEHLSEDPQNEIAVMQYLKEYHATSAGQTETSAEQAIRETKVMMPLDFFYDQTFLYSIMPFCKGGELFSVLEQREKFTESECRFLVKNILDGLEFLQRAGVSHKDMSLENLMIDEDGNTLIIDMGMCIKIPYTEPESELMLTDDRRRKTRRLITPRPRCGKWYYMSPEIYNMQAFDGYSVDLWAVGVILIMMLTGAQPWELPDDKDTAFRYMCRGHLATVMRDHWHCHLSEDALDLLQKMLFLNPRQRLSLDQIRSHCWFDGSLLNPYDL